jgi:hypothetical protein
MARACAAWAAMAWAALAVPGQGETEPQPPLWAYLAECSAVFEVLALADGYAGTSDSQRADALTTAGLFLAEAEQEAAADGQADPQGAVASVMGYLRERWQNRSENLLSLPSNLKWIEYCGRLGRERGLLPLSN